MFLDNFFELNCTKLVFHTVALVPQHRQRGSGGGEAITAGPSLGQDAF